MIVHYVDTSAWVKRYVQERGSAWMATWLSKGPHLACATLGLIEMLCAVSRKQRAGELSAARYGVLVEQVETDYATFAQIDLSQDVLAIARAMPSMYALRGADTVHLASAIALREELAGEADDVIIVSTAAELKQAARLARFRVLDPEESER